MGTRASAVTVALLCAASAGWAQSLKVGSKAPELSVEEWIKGEQVTGFEKGRTYVVEFWATWCPPCVESIPHLSKLQKSHPEVTIIGVAASERGNADKLLPNLKSFVDKKGDDMAYRVAYDSDKSMSAAWMKAAGQGGIPTAFVVNGEGNIAWIGHPMGGLDEAVAAAAQPAGSDEPAKKADEKAQPQVKELAIGDKAPELKIEKWIKGAPITAYEKGKVYVVEFWATWCGPCIAGMPHLSELQKEYKDKDVTIIGVNIWEDREYTEKTVTKVEQFVKGKGDTMGYHVAFDGGKKHMDMAFMQATGQDGIPSAFIVDQQGRVAWIGHPMSMDKPLSEIVAGTYDIKKAAESFKASNAGKKAMRSIQQAMAKGDMDTVYKEMAEGLNKFWWDDAQTLNSLSWAIVDPQGGVEKKDLDLAMKAANRACELTEWKDGAILDTLARVYYVKGDVSKAIELQTKAVEHAQPQMVEELKAVLEEYKKAGGKG